MNKKEDASVCLTHPPAFSLRCLADSNCCRRFCRPLTKPLIQGTKVIYNFTIYNLLFYYSCLSFVELRCKDTTKCEKRKVKSEKISVYCLFFLSPFTFCLLYQDFSPTYYIYTARQVLVCDSLSCETIGSIFILWLEL